MKDTISRGLDPGLFAYVGKRPDGRYEPFVYKRSLPAADVEISDEVFLISAERAQAYLVEQANAGAGASGPAGGGASAGVSAPTPPEVGAGGSPHAPMTTASTFAGFTWSGDVPHQKWMNFYTKVLSRFSNSGGLKIRVTIDVSPPGGVSTGSVEETKGALRELGATEDVELKGH